VEYDTTIIPLEILIEVHLRTHKSTSEHSMRKKYRSAIYVFSQEEEAFVSNIIEALQPKFSGQFVTQVLLFSKFKPSREEIVNYYYKNPQKPFCETFINPKLKVLLNEFSGYAKAKNMQHIN
jgi:peptide-methionine (S)-S-oxide reductase